MERGWEKRWDDVMGARGGEWMAASFETLADPDPASAVPLVLLNTTTVEEGRRALITLLNTRDARGTQAQRIPLPLGWMLSDLARSVLDQQVVHQTCLRNPALCDSPR